MADTSAMKRAERIAIELALGSGYAARKMRLTWGGEFAVDGASEDGETIACVSTAGNAKPGPLHKMRDDASMLMHIAGAKRRVMIFTHRTLYDYMIAQRAAGRFYPESQIELKLVTLPKEVEDEVVAARGRSSIEVSPHRA